MTRTKRNEALIKAIGEKLRDYRHSMDRTLEDVAKKSEISLGYLSQIERGQNSASVEVIFRICQALDVPVSGLFLSVERELQ